jgi:hypothetical protein
MFNCSDGELEAQESVQDASDRVAEASAMEAAAEIMAEPVADIEADPRTKSVSEVAAATADASDNNNAEPLDPEMHATFGNSDLDATIADFAEKQQNETEATDSQVQVETEAPTWAGPLVCKLAGGCHYGGCQGQRRCLAV